MLLPLAVLGQTLSTPPKKTVAPAAKQAADPALTAKVNALIKKQSSVTATSTTHTAAAPAQSAAADQPTETPKPAPVPESKVDRLITEREQLVMKYDYLKTQETNFFGKASKEDLQAVIEALKEVLKKDEQIIQAVEQANLETRRSVAKRAAELEAEAKKLNNQVQGDKRVVTDNIYELKASLANAQNLNRRRDRQLKEMEERLETANDAKFEHDAIAAFLAVASMALVWYIMRLRSQLVGLKKKKQTVTAWASAWCGQLLI